MSRLRTLREARGLRREDLASKAGISLGHVYRLEAGERAPGLQVARRVAEALGVTVDEAFPAPEATAPMVAAGEGQ